MCKWRWDAGVQLQFTQRLEYKISKHRGPKRKWPLTSTLFIFFTRPKKNGCPTMHRHYSCNNSHFIIWVTAWLSLAIKSQRKKAEGEDGWETKPRKANEPNTETKTRKHTGGSFHSTSNISCLYHHRLLPEQGMDREYIERDQKKKKNRGKNWIREQTRGLRENRKNPGGGNRGINPGRTKKKKKKTAEQRRGSGGRKHRIRREGQSI